MNANHDFCYISDTVRELLTHVPGTVKSDPPTGGSLAPELGAESGMTPLHYASYSGNENVVRLLLNSAGVQVINSPKFHWLSYKTHF